MQMLRAALLKATAQPASLAAAKIYSTLQLPLA
jgi:hypothetical protein